MCVGEEDWNWWFKSKFLLHCISYWEQERALLHCSTFYISSVSENLKSGQKTSESLKKGGIIGKESKAYL